MAMKVKQDAKQITITIDVTDAAFKSAPLSNSGKNCLLGSTGGNTNVMLLDGRSVKLGVNCYFDPSQREAE